MMIRNDNALKAASNFIICQFSRFSVHKRCSGIRGKPNKDSKFKRQTYTNQQTDTAGNCPSTELNGLSIENMEMFFYLGDIIGDRGDTLGIYEISSEI